MIEGTPQGSERSEQDRESGFVSINTSMAYIDIDGQVRPHTPNDAPGIFTVSGLGIGQCRITFENREMDCHALRNQDDYLVYVPLSCIQETTIQLDEQHISEDIMRSL